MSSSTAAGSQSSPTRRAGSNLPGRDATRRPRPSRARWPCAACTCATSPSCTTTGRRRCGSRRRASSPRSTIGSSRVRWRDGPVRGARRRGREMARPRTARRAVRVAARRSMAATSRCRTCRSSPTMGGVSLSGTPQPRPGRAVAGAGVRRSDGRRRGPPSGRRRRSRCRARRACGEPSTARQAPSRSSTRFDAPSLAVGTEQGLTASGEMLIDRTRLIANRLTASPHSGGEINAALEVPFGGRTARR